MQTSSVRRARRKPERKARLSADKCDLHLLEDGKASGSYWLTRIPCDFPGCVAFRLERFPIDVKPGEATHYDTTINPASPAGCSCECKGYLRWRHCKHVESLTALLAAGRLS